MASKWLSQFSIIKNIALRNSWSHSKVHNEKCISGSWEKYQNESSPILKLGKIVVNLLVFSIISILTEILADLKTARNWIQVIKGRWIARWNSNNSPKSGILGRTALFDPMYDMSRFVDIVNRDRVGHFETPVFVILFWQQNGRLPCNRLKISDFI